uniref:Uncharacterized protein n=1 Tax=Oryza rufipogon TaxID=4529 RepID=A0A0E0NXK9_ORYRU
MVGAEGWRRLRRCSSYRGCSSSTNGGGGRGVGGCVLFYKRAAGTAGCTSEQGRSGTCQSLRSESSCKKLAWIYWGYTKFLDWLSSNKKMVGKETTGQIALDDITPMDMALMV